MDNLNKLYQIKEENKMTNLQELIRKNEIENQNRTNSEIDNSGMAYKIKDIEENIFVFGGIENGHPWYRGQGGQKHIFQLDGYEIIEKYIR